MRDTMRAIIDIVDSSMKIGNPEKNRCDLHLIKKLCEDELKSAANVQQIRLVKTDRKGNEISGQTLNLPEETASK